MAKCKSRVKHEEMIVVTFCMDCSDDVVDWISCNLNALARVFAVVALRRVMRGKPLPSPAEFERFCRRTHASCVQEYRDMTATRH